MQALARERREIKPDDHWLEPAMAHRQLSCARATGAQIIGCRIADCLRSPAWCSIVVAANLGNLVMSRAMGRVRELGLRMALGARRGRIVRQLRGRICAAGRPRHARQPSVRHRSRRRCIASLVQLPPYLDFGLDWRDAVIAAALAALALVVVGVLPAWKVAQQHLIDAIKDGGQHRVARARSRDDAGA